MPKFSIIIPVHNVEEYIGACLESIKNQTFDDYEVIVVDDGSTDNSLNIIEKYDVRIIKQETSGVSEARNNGIRHAKGEYLVFVDSDDYIEKDLLKTLNEELKDKPEIVRYQVQDVYPDKEPIKREEEVFDTQKGEKAFEKICRYHYVESAWTYCVKRSYYEKNNFEFAKGRIHEDFGLVPLIVIKSKRIKSIPYIGYNYRHRANSIMNNKNYEHTKRKVDDFFYHYVYLMKEINKTNLDSTYFKSFISNSLIIKITELNKKDYKEYKKILKEEKVYDNLLTNTFKRRIKKLLLKISPRLAVKIIK